MAVERSPSKMSCALVTLRGLLIDLDGTLADSLPAMRDAYEAFLGAYERSGTADEFNRLNGPGLPEIVRILKETHRLPDSEDVLLDRYRSEIEQLYAVAVKPNVGAVELLALADERGVRCVLVTSALGCVAEAFLGAHALRDRFELLVTGDDVNVAKPNPMIYRLALARAGLTAAQAVAVEDSDAGEASARGARLRVWRADAGLTEVIDQLRRETGG